MRASVVASLVLLTLPLARGEAASQRVHTPSEKAARNAQRVFESRRRFELPHVTPRRDACDVTIGRFCYWNDDGEAPLPAEGPKVVRDRVRLRTALDSLAALDSTSDYIAGQRVRYAIEAHDTSAEIAIAGGCRATPWWCEALRGLVWHRLGREVASDAAFDSALAAMPDTARCEWLDVRSWLPDGVDAPREKGAPCAQTEALSARLLWLAAPLLTWRPDAIRDEFLSRRTTSLILAGTATPHALSWGADMAEVSLRFGWPDRWAREDERSFTVALPDVHVVGDEPTPSFDFVPDRHALESPLDAVPSDFAGDGTVMRYAPGWLRELDSLPVQIARFRRAGGDSAVIVVVYDAGAALRDTLDGARAVAIVSTGPDSLLSGSASDARSMGTLVFDAPARPMLAAVEVVDSSSARAARWRSGLAPLDRAALISDLLVGVARPGLREVTLDSIERYAVAAPHPTPNDTLALYWESYAHPEPSAPAHVSLTLVPLSAGLVSRIAHSLGLARASAPLAIAWDDVGTADSSVARSLRVGIPDVPPGRYRIELTIEARGRRGSASREIDVVRVARP